MLSGEGFGEVLGADGKTHIGEAPLERLIEMPPGAFIAVRRNNVEDAARYADSIRAFLTGTFVLTGGRPRGFANTPLPMHWAAIPFQAKLNAQGQFEASYKFAVSSSIHINPIHVTWKALANSWTHGTPIHGTWVMSQDSPLSAALVGNWKTLSPLRARIRDAATILCRAMESPDTTISTLFSVAALETLLRDNNTNFSEMEELATCIFADANGPSAISALISNRHKVAHHAKEAHGADKHAAELAAAWAIILHAAILASHMSSTDDFLAHLRGRILARRVGRELRDHNRADLAAEVERLSTFPKPKKKGNK